MSKSDDFRSAAKTERIELRLLAISARRASVSSPRRKRERERGETAGDPRKNKTARDDEEGELKSGFVKIKRTHRIESMYVSMLYRARARKSRLPNRNEREREIRGVGKNVRAIDRDTSNFPSLVDNEKNTKKTRDTPNNINAPF